MKRRDFIKGAVAAGGGLIGTGMLGTGDVLAETSVGDEKKTTKRALVVYASRTNNTAKVAERFKATLEKNGWQCDIYRIKQNSDPMEFPYKLKEYDLVCAGSGVRMHSPYAELLHVLRVPVYGFDPRIMLKSTEGVELTEEEKKKMQAAMSSRAGSGGHRKIVLGPNAGKAFSFVTYGGHEYGPKEALPALEWINIELAHLEVEIVGKFCCPGKFENTNNPSGYHNDLSTRPNEKDLMRAELFIEQVLEDIAERPSRSV